MFLSQLYQDLQEPFLRPHLHPHLLPRLHPLIYSLTTHIRPQWCLEPNRQAHKVRHKVKLRLGHARLLAKLVDIRDAAAPALHLTAFEQSSGNLLVHRLRVRPLQEILRTSAGRERPRRDLLYASSILFTCKRGKQVFCISPTPCL